MNNARQWDGVLLICFICYIQYSIIQSLYMKQIYLLENDSLKCNFCTKWFNAPWDFVQQQRYSLNACFGCSSNKHLKIVNPKTYEVLEVRFIKTGIHIFDKHEQLSGKLARITEGLHEREMMGADLRRELEDLNQREYEEYRELKETYDNRRQNIDRLYTELIEMVGRNYDKYKQGLESGIQKFLNHKQELISKLQHRFLNPGSETDIDLDKIRSSFEQYKKSISQFSIMAANSQQNRLYQSLSRFINANFKSNSHLKPPPSHNKENQPNNPIKSIRYKLTDQTLLSTSRKSTTRNSRYLISSLSKSKNLKASVAFTERTSASRERFGSRSRSKENNMFSSVKYGVVSDVRINSEFDDLRDQAHKALKQRCQFETYMPTDVYKENPYQNRVYGEKQHKQILIQLKERTVVTDQLCELINKNLSKGKIVTYLNFMTLHDDIEIMRFVKTHLRDVDFDNLLFWIKDKPELETLVLTNNNLTQNCIHGLIQFKRRHSDSKLKYVYLGNNFIKPIRVKTQVQLLKDMGVLVQL